MVDHDLLGGELRTLMVVMMLLLLLLVMMRLLIRVETLVRNEIRMLLDRRRNELVFDDSGRTPEIDGGRTPEESGV